MLAYLHEVAVTTQVEVSSYDVAGSEKRPSADQRKKAQYRMELQQQMEEAKRNKQR